MFDDKELTCQDCGTAGSQDNEVSEGTCPFASDVHNEIVDVVLCEKCNHERCMDI